MKIDMNLEVQFENGTLFIRNAQGGSITYTKEQVVQRKINMVTLGELTKIPKLEIARAFGYTTRKSYYDAKNAILNGSIEDLIPKKSGPKRPRKRTRELEILVIQLRFETDYNMYEIADHLKNLGFNVSSRLVGEIIKDYGLSKKNFKNREGSSMAFRD